MRRRTRVAITTVVLLATAAAIAFVVYLSLDPANYFFYRTEDRAKWVYRPAGVVEVGAFMLAEAAVMLAALVATWPRVLWLRCIVPLGLLYAFFCFLPVIHMPAYVMFHF